MQRCGEEGKTWWTQGFERKGLSPGKNDGLNKGNDGEDEDKGNIWEAFITVWKGQTGDMKEPRGIKNIELHI